MTDGLTQSNTSFSDMGVNDIELGVVLHRTLGINEFDLSMPDNMNKLREISEFMNQHPDAVSTVERVARSNRNPNTSQLDHMMGFVSLSKEKLRILDGLDNINNQLKYYE